MLVQTFSHLIPPSNGYPTVLSSATTSSHIPDVPCDDLSRRQYVQSGNIAHAASARRDRRLRTAPYPLSIPAAATRFPLLTSSGQDHPVHHDVPLHSPRPVSYYNRPRTFDRMSASNSISSPLAFSPGAHGTILEPFEIPTESGDTSSGFFREVTATQLAGLPTDVTKVCDTLAYVSSPCSSRHSQSNLPRESGQYFQITVPQIPSVPPVPVPSSVPSSDPPSPSISNNCVPYLPDAIPPETSQLLIKPSGALPPPSDTFPTPVDLLSELSLRDAESEQKDRRRVERRKAQIQREAETLGFTPTDP